MQRPDSQYQKIKAVFQRKQQSPYEAFREALRLAIPYVWRRRAVNFVRNRFRMKLVSDWIRSQLSREQDLSPRKSWKRGDFYESVTLLPHLLEAEAAAILDDHPPTATPALPDVICFSIIDWSFRFQRPQQLMVQFAAHGHRVFYLSTTQFQSQYARPKFSATEIRANLFEVKIAAGSALTIFETVVQGKNLELALSSLDELRRAFNINEIIGYVMIPSWTEVALATREMWGWRTIYDCMDEWENFPKIDPQLVEMEKRLVEGCDLLVVTAQQLYDKWRGYQRPMVLARNAADYGFYAERCRPNDLLDGIKHPIIGYFGGIADWFDFDLMAEIARLRPQYTFVLLGGVYDVDVSKLQALPNVRLLGQQPYETMPSYLYHFDVCIIPFKINSITEATDPVKLYEYLSGGKPVVSVDLPELKPYRDDVYIAGDPLEFVDQIDLALAEDRQQLIERRRGLASQHTWSARYRSILSEFKKTVPRASIVIVTYNNLAVTKLCLESLFRNTDYPNYEVIIVDNNSVDGTQKYLQGLNEERDNVVIILNEGNNGFARANNQGIEASTGEYLVLLNNDAIVPQGWLSRLLAHLSDPQVGLAGPVTNFVGNEAKIAVNYQTWAEMEDFAQRQVWQHHQEVAEIHMLAMFCVALRKEVFEKVGPLDEQFGIGMFEDDDYSVRIRQLGYRVICVADAFVHHFGQASFGKLIPGGDYDRLFNTNREKYEKKWGIEWKPHKNARLSFKVHSFHQPGVKTEK